jgi:hypothetical protein
MDMVSDLLSWLDASWWTRVECCAGSAASAGQMQERSTRASVGGHMDNWVGHLLHAHVTGTIDQQISVAGIRLLASF